MYLAQLSSLQTQAPFYINSLESIIHGNNTPESKEKIDSAISEAIDIAKGQKNIYSVDNNHYFFIATLLANYRERLIQVEKDNFGMVLYVDILKIFK